MTDLSSPFGEGINPFTGRTLQSEGASSAFEDAIYAVPRGIAGAVENIVDLVPGVDLPENLGLGQSETGLGGFIEGTTSFLTGFVPAVGILGRVGKASKLGRATRLHKLSKKRQLAAQRVGATGTAKLINFGRATVAGGVADFAVFDGNDPRFSNLVQGVPGMENAVTEFLAADEDDGEYTGRIKNLMEGLLMGGVVDGVLSILGKLKRQNKIVEKMSLAEEDEALSALVEEHDQISREIAEEAQETIAKPMSLGEQFEENFAERYRKKGNGPDGGVTGPLDTDKITKDAVDLMGLDAPKTKEVLEKLTEARKSGDNPLDKIEGVVNLATLQEPALRAVMRTLNDTFKFESIAGKLTDADMIRQGKEEIQAKTGRPAQWIIEDIGNDAAAQVGIRRRLFVYNQVQNRLLKDFAELADGALSGKGYQELTAEQAMVQSMHSLETIGVLTAQLGRLRGEVGRTLRSMRGDIMGSALLQGDELQRALNEAGGTQSVRKVLTKFMDAYRTSPNAAAKLAMKKTRLNKFWAMGLDLYYGSLLSGPLTHAKNLVGATATSFFRPLEKFVGAKVAAKVADPELATQLKRVASRELMAADLLKSQFVKMGKYVARQGDKPAAAKWGAESFREAQDRLVGGPGILEVQKANREITVGNVNAVFPWANLEEGRGFGMMVSKMANLVEAPGKALAAEDQFVKQAVYSSYVEAEIRLQGIEQGLTGEALDEFAQLNLDGFLREGAALTKENLTREAESLTEFAPQNFASQGERTAAIEEWVSKKLSDEEQGLEAFQIKGRKTIAEEGVRIAREVTFQTELDPERGLLSGLGSSASKVMARHPYLRFHLPFVRTPLNLLTYGLDRSPVPIANDAVLGLVQWLNAKSPIGVPVLRRDLKNAQNKWVQQIMSDDPEVVAEAWGRGVTTAASMMTLGSFAAAGMITGRGPADHNLRNNKQQAGWQPYSLKLGDTYVSYQGLDPLATILGIYGDLADYLEFEEDDAGFQGILKGIFASTVTTMTSKSYLQGMVGLMDALSSGDLGGTVDQVVYRPLSSLAVPAIAAQFRDVTDPNINEARGLLDRMWNRVPGLGSDVLDKRRNAIGEAFTRKTYEGVGRVAEGLTGFFMPLSLNFTTSDVLNKELEELDYPFKAPSYNRYGMDLRDHQVNEKQSAYDRWQELTSTIKIEGRTLRSHLERLVKSREYQALPREGDTDTDVRSPRVDAIYRLIRVFRAQAEQEMLKEFPEVQEASRNRIVQRYAFKFGQSPEVTRATIFPNDG